MSEPAVAVDTELILHHYDFSNYSEKVRPALGYKGLAWRSVIVPPVLPKPDLMPLTGGYRRTPVLQVGADVYCDTRLILAELERRCPEPTLFPPVQRALANAIAYWAEQQLFRPISLYVSGTNADVLPPELQADRSRMRGLPVPDTATMQRAAKRNAPPVRVQLAWIEEMLSDGRDWVAGPVVSIADFAVYHALWFIIGPTDRLRHELESHRRVRAWMDRMRAFGHGTSRAMTPEEALRVAAQATPEAPRRSRSFAEDPSLGTRVRVRADDYARDPVEGELVVLDDDEIALRRQDEQVGEVVVHFPRLGYDLRAL